MSLIHATFVRATQKFNIVLYPGKLFDDSDNMGNTLYHHEAHSDSPLHSPPPHPKKRKKVKYTILAFDISHRIIRKALLVFHYIQMLYFQMT